MVRGFKSATTKRINELRGTPKIPVWQRNYYEHIIRDDESLNRLRQYIRDNPAQWAMDRENPRFVAQGTHDVDVWAYGDTLVRHGGETEVLDDVSDVGAYGHTPRLGATVTAERGSDDGYAPVRHGGETEVLDDVSVAEAYGHTPRLGATVTEVCGDECDVVGAGRRSNGGGEG